MPARHGGLGITDPSQKSSSYYEDYKSIATPIVNAIIDQSRERPPQMKEAHLQFQRQQAKVEASRIAESLSSNLQTAIGVSSEKGASTWLTTLPLADHGFTLHKGAFRDALCLRYGWVPQELPAQVV